LGRESFLKGAFILALAGLVSRSLGAVYRIFLTRLVHTEAMGLFSMAYSIYSVILGLSAVGIPIAISKLVAEKGAEKDARGMMRVFRLAAVLLASSGLVFSVLLFLAAGFLSEHVYQDPRAVYSLRAIAPAIFFVSVMAAFRGFFQGLQRMTPTAASQIIEQVVRVVTMFVLAYLLLPRGLEFAAAGATFGATTGGIAGLTFILVVFLRYRFSQERPAGTQDSTGQDSVGAVFKRLFTLAIPISLAAIVLPIMSFIDSTIVPLRLQAAGYGVREATNLYGQLANIAFPLVNMPTIVTVALAVSLVPAVSEALVSRNYGLIRSRATAALRVTFIFALPAAAGLYLLAVPISDLLYDIPEGGFPLAALAPGMFFLALQQTSSGVLQGLGRSDIPVKNLLLGAAWKLAFTWVLTAVPRFGIQGAALASTIGFGLAAGLNLRAVYQLVGMGFSIVDMLWKPLLATGVMGVVARGTHYFLGFQASASLATLFAILAAALAYGLVLLLIGGIRSRDLEMIPKAGEKIAKVLGKAGLLKK